MCWSWGEGEAGIEKTQHRRVQVAAVLVDI
jgi:hypothetical protein